MDSIYPKVASALVLVATTMYAIFAHAVNEATSQAEARLLPVAEI